MTNEELVAKIQAGDDSLQEHLWLQVNCSVARVEKASAFALADAVNPARRIEYDCVRRFSYNLGTRRHASTIKYDI